MKVKRNTLLLLAALVWGIAGANILRIGLAGLSRLSHPVEYPAFGTGVCGIPTGGLWKAGEKTYRQNRRLSR